jgi:hypothetical protein
MLNRREFAGGMGLLALRLLFRRRGAAAEAALVDDPEVADQAPSAIEITVIPQHAFLPERLVIPTPIARVFMIEDITIGPEAQFAGGSIPAEMFAAGVMDGPSVFSAAAPGAEIKFRVRYIGDKPGGERFIASLVGRSARSTGNSREVLPISSDCAVVA